MKLSVIIWCDLAVMREKHDTYTYSLSLSIYIYIERERDIVMLPFGSVSWCGSKTLHVQDDSKLMNGAKGIMKKRKGRGSAFVTVAFLFLCHMSVISPL